MIGIGLATILTSVSYLTPRFAPSLPATNAFCGFSFPLGKQVKKQNRIARERHKSYEISDRQSGLWRKRGTGVDPHCACCSFWRVVHVRVPMKTNGKLRSFPLLAATQMPTCISPTTLKLCFPTALFRRPSLHSRRLDTVFPSLQTLRILS